MIEYKEIDFDDYCDLDDTSGYYRTIVRGASSIWYRKNDKAHRIDGPAKIYKNVHYYCLDGKQFGSQKDFTDETWKIFATRYMKLQAFK